MDPEEAALSAGVPRDRRKLHGSGRLGLSWITVGRPLDTPAPLQHDSNDRTLHRQANSRASQETRWMPYLCLSND